MWTIVIFLIIIITNVTIEILFFLVIIGLLVIYEFTKRNISYFQKNRLLFTIFIFFIIIILILIKKLISMSNM